MSESNRYWIAYLTLAIFATQLLVNAVVLAVVIHFTNMLKNYLEWSKEYKTITKSYSDMIAEHKMDYARQVADIASVTQQKMSTAAGEIKEEVRKAVQDIKEQATTIQQQQNGDHP